MGNIAIKGHPTRGKEVIEILEMLGAKNKYNLSGDGTNAYYIKGSDLNDLSKLLDKEIWTYNYKSLYSVFKRKSLGELNCTCR